MRRRKLAVDKNYGKLEKHVSYQSLAISRCILFLSLLKKPDAELELGLSAELADDFDEVRRLITLADMRVVRECNLGSDYCYLRVFANKQSQWLAAKAPFSSKSLRACASIFLDLDRKEAKWVEISNNPGHYSVEFDPEMPDDPKKGVRENQIPSFLRALVALYHELMPPIVHDLGTVLVGDKYFSVLTGEEVMEPSTFVRLNICPKMSEEEYDKFMACDFESELDRIEYLLRLWVTDDESFDNLCLLITQGLFSYVREQDSLLSIISGEAEIGKTSLAKIIEAIYGMVATVKESELLDTNSLVHMNAWYQVALKGKFFTVINEVPYINDKVLDPLKLITSGDKFTIKQMSANNKSRVVESTSNVLLLTNAEVEVSNKSEFKRRLCSINFRKSDAINAAMPELKSGYGAALVLLVALRHRARITNNNSIPARFAKHSIVHSYTPFVDAKDEYSPAFLQSVLKAGSVNTATGDLVITLNALTGLKRRREFSNFDKWLKDYAGREKAPRIDGKQVKVVTLDYNLLLSDINKDYTAPKKVGTIAFETLNTYNNVKSTKPNTTPFDPNKPAFAAAEIDKIFTQLKDKGYSNKQIKDYLYANSKWSLFATSTNGGRKVEAGQTLDMLILDYDNCPIGTDVDSVAAKISSLTGPGVYSGVWETISSTSVNPKLRVMIALSRIDSRNYNILADLVDAAIGLKRCSGNKPTQLQALAFHSLPHKFNLGRYAWQIDVDSGDHTEYSEIPVADQMSELCKQPYKDWDKLVENFKLYVERFSEQLQDRTWWVNNCLMPICLYTKYAGVLNEDEAAELIQLSARPDVPEDVEGNLRQLAIDLHTDAGYNLFNDGFDKSIDEWFTDYTVSLDDFDLVNAPMVREVKQSPEEYFAQLLELLGFESEAEYMNYILDLPYPTPTSDSGREAASEVAAVAATSTAATETSYESALADLLGSSTAVNDNLGIFVPRGTVLASDFDWGIPMLKEPLPAWFQRDSASTIATDTSDKGGYATDTPFELPSIDELLGIDVHAPPELAHLL